MATTPTSRSERILREHHSAIRLLFPAPGEPVNAIRWTVSDGTLKGLASRSRGTIATQFEMA